MFRRPHKAFVPPRCLIGARIAATLRRVLDAAVAHSTIRWAYGRKLAEFDEIKFRLAKVWNY